VVSFFYVIFVIEIRTTKQISMIERLKICWYVLTRHTYAVFFCSKDWEHQECFEKNTFDEFNQAIVEFVSGNYE
jgi:hypothetical protein